MVLAMSFLGQNELKGFGALGLPSAQPNAHRWDVRCSPQGVIQQQHQEGNTKRMEGLIFRHMIKRRLNEGVRM
jgi:hypothetical protein